MHKICCKCSRGLIKCKPSINKMCRNQKRKQGIGRYQPKREVGQFPSQPISNPSNQSMNFAGHQASTLHQPSMNFEKIEAVTTLRNGKILGTHMKLTSMSHPQHNMRMIVTTYFQMEKRVEQSMHKVRNWERD